MATCPSGQNQLVRQEKPVVTDARTSVNEAILYVDF